MEEMNKVSKGKSLPEIDISNILPPKPEIDDFELEFETSNRIGLDVASSSGSNVRSVLIGMGFAPPLVNRVIEEKVIVIRMTVIELICLCSNCLKSNGMKNRPTRIKQKLGRDSDFEKLDNKLRNVYPFSLRLFDMVILDIVFKGKLTLTCYWRLSLDILITKGQNISHQASTISNLLSEMLNLSHRASMIGDLLSEMLYFLQTSQASSYQKRSQMC